MLVCLVVSEESGAISLTDNGQFKRDLEKLTLKETLKELINPDMFVDLVQI